MRKNKILRYVGIIVLCALLDASLHAATSKISPIPEDGEFSLLVKAIGTPGAAISWIFLAFSTAACIFYRYEKRLPGSGIIKGLYYGGSVGLLWFWGMLEGIPLLGHTLLSEGVMGLSDTIPMVLMGLLLGKFASDDEEAYQSNKYSKSKKSILTPVTISLAFLAGRYVLYFTEIIESGYKTRALLTFGWTLFMGICIGIGYNLLSRGLRTASKFVRAMKFGTIIFGVNWFVFLSFISFIYAGTIFNIILRSVVDICSVSLGCYLAEILAE